MHHFLHLNTRHGGIATFSSKVLASTDTLPRGTVCRKGSDLFFTE